VIDDVLGLVILAVVSSLVEAGTVSIGEVVLIIVKAVAFLGGSIAIGRAMAPHLLRWASRLDSSHSMLFSLVLVVGLFMAWLAHAVGLAAIIGAFAAGLPYAQSTFFVDESKDRQAILDAYDAVVLTGADPRAELDNAVATVQEMLDEFWSSRP